MGNKINQAYLLTGTNMGEREANLQKANGLIEQKIGKIKEQSKLYESQAWGKTDQPDFINQALLVETQLTPKETLTQILGIEAEMGRVRTAKWEERNIDIDILLYNDAVINESDLVIPHAHLHERNFALIPLMEIAGEVEHPVLKQNVEDIYFDCTDPLEVFLIEN